jgi:hypothetical protein
MSKGEVDMNASIPTNSLLIGLLIDVSGSMTSSIKNSRTSQNRLESFRDALEDLVRKYASATESRDRVGSAELFAYGFGFGNPLTQLLGKQGPAVRDLFLLSGIPSSTVDVVQLAKEWPRYRSHVEGLATEMFGSTPMREGLSTIQQRFRAEAGREHGERILFLLSDGEPTDSRPDEIVRIADELKRDGIFVVSCFVTSEDFAEARHIYGRAPSQWSEGARLMFDCSSVVPADSPFLFYLKEHRWKVDDKGRLFTQINQSELLAEFMNVVLSPFTGDAHIDAGSGIIVQHHPCHLLAVHLHASAVQFCSNPSITVTTTMFQSDLLNQ